MWSGGRPGKFQGDGGVQERPEAAVLEQGKEDAGTLSNMMSC